MTRPKPHASLALIAVTAIWGATFLMVKDSLGAISPLIFLALRFGLASMVLAILYRRRFVRGVVGAGILNGALLFGGYAFQTIGLETTSASKSAFLTSLSVPMVPFVAWAVYKNRPRRFEILGVAVASAGMISLTVPGRLGDIGRGDWLSLGCAVCFAGQIVALSHFSGKGNFESLVTVQMMTVTALALATFRWVETPVFRPTAASWVAVAATGLLATALAFSVQAWGQQYVSVTRAAIIYSLEPVFAWVTSYLLAGELLSYRGTAGAVLILAGILIVELKRVDTNAHQLIQ